MSRADRQESAESGGSFRRLLLVACSAVLLILVLAGYEASRDLARLKAREAQLEDRLEATRGRIERLGERIRDLDSDPATLERVAREELGLARPDEIVVVLPAEETASPERP